MTDPRFSIIPAGAVLDPRVEPRDLQVLCLFGRHTDRKGWCRRSQVQMAKEIGCARSTVQASIERLVAAGWLQRRPAGDLHTPGVRDSAHEYRVVLDVADDPQDVVGTPADTSAPPAALDRHPLPTHGSAPMLTTPLNDKTPQPPASGGQGFADMWEAWPRDNRGRRDNAEGTFARMTPADQRAALRLAPTVIAALAKRKQRIPALVAYLRRRVFAEFDGAPEIDADGYFVIKPGMPEWGEWLGWMRKKYGQRAVDQTVAAKVFLTRTRLPDADVVERARSIVSAANSDQGAVH